MTDDTTRMIDIGRHALHVHDVGNGPAVVLIHGLAGDLSAWGAQIERCGRAFASSPSTTAAPAAAPRSTSRSRTRGSRRTTRWR